MQKNVYTTIFKFQIISNRFKKGMMVMPATQRQMEYDNENTVQIKLKLNLNTDADVINALNEAPLSEGGKQGYIKRLIREDIARKQKQQT